LDSLPFRTQKHESGTLCSATMILYAFQNLPAQGRRHYRELQHCGFVLNDHEELDNINQFHVVPAFLAPPAPSTLSSSLFRRLYSSGVSNNYMLLPGKSFPISRDPPLCDTSRDTITTLSRSRFFLQISQKSMALDFTGSC
jgi:hypothetical protein